MPALELWAGRPIFGAKQHGAAHDSPCHVPKKNDLSGFRGNGIPALAPLNGGTSCPKNGLMGSEGCKLRPMLCSKG